MIPATIDNRNSTDISDAYQMPNSIWIDVRCPREFSKGHFTKATNIPLFSDSQYEKIGQTYKKIGQESATEMGLKYASKSSTGILKQISNLNSKNIIMKSLFIILTLFTNIYSSVTINDNSKLCSILDLIQNQECKDNDKSFCKMVNRVSKQLCNTSIFK